MAVTDGQSLYLDPAIRDWVLIPIMIVMVLVGVLRHHVTLLIRGSPKKQPLKTIREQRALVRATVLRANGNHIPASSFNSRKTFLTTAFENHAYLADPSAAQSGRGATNPLTDPSGMEMMMEGMKSNLIMVVPQTIIMGWINFFFSGFILIKLPFPLTIRFKSMLQRGVETADMDVAWVSSLSWYFLNLFGLRSIFALILGEDNAADGMRDMQAMGALQGVPTGGPGQPDPVKRFAAEKENMDLTEHKWELQDVDTRLLEKYGKIPKTQIATR